MDTRVERVWSGGAERGTQASARMQKPGKLRTKRGTTADRIPSGGCPDALEQIEIEERRDWDYWRGTARYRHSAQSSHTTSPEGARSQKKISRRSNQCIACTRYGRLALHRLTAASRGAGSSWAVIGSSFPAVPGGARGAGGYFWPRAGGACCRARSPRPELPRALHSSA